MELNIHVPNKKILVVDDEEDILDLVEYNLKKEGYLKEGHRY